MTSSQRGGKKDTSSSTHHRRPTSRDGTERRREETQKEWSSESQVKRSIFFIFVIFPTRVRCYFWLLEENNNLGKSLWSNFEVIFFLMWKYRCYCRLLSNFSACPHYHSFSLVSSLGLVPIFSLAASNAWRLEAIMSQGAYVVQR